MSDETGGARRMRSLSRTWPPVTDRYARMRKRAATAPNADKLRDEFEAAWADTVGGDPMRQKLILLPSTPQVERRPTRLERRRNRQRKHTHNLLIDALRSDGTPGSTIRVRTCKAFRVLPWEIGLPWSGRMTAGLVTADEIRASEGIAVKQRADEMAATLNEHVLGPLLWDLQLETGADIEPGLRFEFTDDTDLTDPTDRSEPHA